MWVGERKMRSFYGNSECRALFPTWQEWICWISITTLWYMRERCSLWKMSSYNKTLTLRTFYYIYYKHRYMCFHSLYYECLLVQRSCDSVVSVLTFIIFLVCSLLLCMIWQLPFSPFHDITGFTYQYYVSVTDRLSHETYNHKRCVLSQWIHFDTFSYIRKRYATAM